MGREFQTPERIADMPGENNKETKNVTILKPLDQAIITALTILICSLLGWIAYTSQQNSVAIVQLDSKFESIKADRDLNMLYVERRIAAMENKLSELIQRDMDRERGRR